MSILSFLQQSLPGLFLRIRHPRGFHTFPEEVRTGLPKISNQWIRDTLGGGSYDKDTAEQGVDMAYRSVGLAPPPQKIWLTSPLEAIRMAMDMQEAHPSVQKKVENKVIEATYAYLQKATSPKVMRQVEETISSIFQDRYDMPVAIRISVALHQEIYPGKAVPNMLMSMDIEEKDFLLGLGMNPGYDLVLANYRAFSHLLPKRQQTMDGLAQIADNCGFCWFLEDVAIFSQPPSRLSFKPWTIEDGKLLISEKQQGDPTQIEDYLFAADHHKIPVIEFGDDFEIETPYRYWKKFPPLLEASLASHIQKWHSIIHSTAPTDKMRAEQAIDLAYQTVGHPPPQQKLWFASPLAAITHGMKLPTRDNPVIIKTLLQNRIYDEVRLHAAHGFRGDEPEDLNQNMEFNWQIIDDEIMKHMGRLDLEHEAEEYQIGYIHQNRDIAFHTMFSVLSPTVKTLLEPSVELAHSCDWWWGTKDTALLVENPTHLHNDSENRLHCEDGPALAYRDGFAVYAWHGYQIDSTVLENRHEMTPDLILKEENAELRRIKMEIFLEIHGAENIVEAFGANILDNTPCLGLERQLIKIGEEHYLYCTNGSLEPDGRRRKFLLGIPSEYTYDWETETEIAPPDTAHEASAWTYGIDPDKYQEQVRT